MSTRTHAELRKNRNGSVRSWFSMPSDTRPLKRDDVSGPIELAESPAPPSVLPSHDFSRVALRSPNAGSGQSSGETAFQSCPLAMAGPRACPFGGACHTCPARIQAKLRIGAPDDEYEREADRVAEQVMRMPAPVFARTPILTPQRQMEAKENDDTLQRSPSPAPEPGSDSSKVPPLVEDVLRSPGQPLDVGTRTFMELRFGCDFGRVRVHADDRAADSAQSVAARAFTVGNNVVFGTAQHAPTTPEGRRLLAHELTHVVQQDAGPALPGRIQRDVDDPGRMAGINQSLFVSAPGSPGSAQQPWQDASATAEGTAALIIRQAKAAVTQLVHDRPLSVGGTIPVQTTETALDADALVANQRIRQRFPQINVSVSDQQITNAVSVLSPAITSDPDYLHQWLANRLIGWTDISRYAIRENDPRFVTMLDALLADPQVGAHLHTLAARQGGYQTGEGLSRTIAVHHGTSADERRLVLIHELVHFYAHATYRSWVDGTTDARFYNEGFAEWLAQRVMTPGERTNRGNYQARFDAIDQQVAAHVSEDDIARAFFNGEVWRIESRSTIARREFAAASGIRERPTSRQEAADSPAGPGLNQEVIPGVRYRFLNLGHDRAEPKPDHVAEFGRLKARYVDSDPQIHIRFVGHASTPGPPAYNDRLSRRRALAFYQMARDAGVPGTRLVNAGNPEHFGETRSTLTEEDAETRAFNRRVEMFLNRAPIPQPVGSPSPGRSDLIPVGPPTVARSPLRLQAKLTVSQPDDKYEREANAVADQIMRMPEPVLARPPLPAFQSAFATP